VRHVTRMDVIIKLCIIKVKNLERRKHSGNISVDGKIILKSILNSKGCEDVN
jgi:hypothetical protein